MPSPSQYIDISDNPTGLSDGIYESRKEADKTSEDMVKRWLSELSLAQDGQKDWRIEAEKARDTFRSERGGTDQRFNILYSNVQTSAPSLYNSTPTPDVRTRYSEDDEVSRVSGQAIERVLSYSIDSYNFDGVMKSVVQDRELAGRGVARVRYMPEFYQDQIYQEVVAEHVPWKHFQHGPAIAWPDVPWVAFEHFLNRDQFMTLNPKIGGSIKLDVSLSDGTGKPSNLKPDLAPNVFKRGRCWEIWDRSSRQVFWIAPSYTAGPVRVDQDPLGLEKFYPVPEPLYAIRTSDTLTPVCPYRIIKPLVDELEEITIRIQALVRVCKWRGVRHPSIPSFERLEEAVDGELIAPLESSELVELTSAGGLDKFIWLMPIEQLIATLQQLYTQRESIKQTIFEVSGLADIMRGQTNPNETLGAQQIKANWGTMRMQEAQKDVQRFVRDLFRLKAEITCNLFDSKNLSMMTGLNLPSRQQVMGAKQQLQLFQQQAQQPMLPPPSGPQPGGPPPAPGGPPPGGGVPVPLQPQGGPPAPPPQPQQPPQQLVDMANRVSWEDVLETLKSGVMRTYRIDIETDSTIQGDVQAKQQQMSMFLQAAGAFVQSMGPAVMGGFIKKDVAIDLFSTAARSFKLGRQAEDALARMSADATREALNPAPPAPNPEVLKLQQAQQQADRELQFKQAQAQADMQLRQAQASSDAQLKQQQAQSSAQLEQYKAQTQSQLQASAQQHDQALKEAQFNHARALQEYEANSSLRKMEQEAMAAAARLKHERAIEEMRVSQADLADARKHARERERTSMEYAHKERQAALDRDLESILVPKGRKQSEARPR